MNFDTRLTLFTRVRDAGDSEAWFEFVNLYTPIIFAFLRIRGLSPTDSEDVTQEVFRDLAKALPSFQLDKSVGTSRNWLFTVTRSKLNTFRANSSSSDSPQSRRPSPQSRRTRPLYF